MAGEAWTAVISAGAALTGVAIAQGIAMLQAHLGRRHARQQLLLTKLEALAEQVVASAMWADELAARLEPDHKPPASSASEQPIPARRVYTAALIYFPPLRAAARRYMLASIGYMSAVTRALADQAKADQAEETHKPDAYEVLSLAASELASAREALDELIAACAAEYTRD